MKYNLIQGNSLERLKDLEENSVDSIVTDPPYELGFMGKAWDKSGIAYNKELWQECLRVLKPGGHLLAFSGTRTYHRMTVAIEDAGFEIRDQIQWLYGSGFPKSTDISKQIDKNAIINKSAIEDKIKCGNWLKDKRLKKNYKIKDVAIYFPSNTGGLTGCVSNWELGKIPTWEHYSKLKEILELDDRYDYLIEDRPKNTIEAEREVIGKKENCMSGWNMDGTTNFVDRNITKPSTPDAIKWHGWGTALKPANEPICVARKPFKTTVAENVLKYGVGAMNIDESRIEYKDEKDLKSAVFGSCTKNPMVGGGSSNGIEVWKKNIEPNDNGRWPANVIHDGLQEEWARYFYCAKASKKDRNEGCDEFEAKMPTHGTGGESGGLQVSDSKIPNQNNHPTVKPTDLMAYLVRLVTPPGGTVLDPFNGSGSTGKACARLGFNYIGIDLSQEYLDISKARIEHELNKK